MKLSLKKARRLETKIANHLNTQSTNTVVRVLANDSHENVLTKVKDTQNKVVTDLDQKIKLTQARYSIRNKIDEQNHKTGISSLMNKREQVQHELKVLNAVSKEAKFNVDEVMLTMSSRKAALEKGERHTDVNIHVDVMDERLSATVKSQVKALRSQLEDIEDQLTQKNAGAEVTLSPEEVELLTVTDLLVV